MAGYSAQSGESAATNVPYSESGDVSEDGVDNTTSTGAGIVSSEPLTLERLMCAEPSHLARKRNKPSTNRHEEIATSAEFYLYLKVNNSTSASKGIF